VHYATLPGFGQAWQNLGTVPGVSTVQPPTLTDGLSRPSESPTLSVIWPLPGGQNIYETTLSSGSWTSPVPITGGSAAAPAATEGPDDGANPQNNLVAWQGAGSDTAIWYTLVQNQVGIYPAWQAQEVATNGPTTTGLAAADEVQCLTPPGGGSCVTTITAYLAWEGPQGQVEFVHGVY
jgi:hypothetical protein